jgi:DNA-binding beta-propeller fold protein YncE
MADLQPGDVFAGHRIEGLAGRGGMGVVYRATELTLERIVALKLIAPALAGDPDFRARFLRESRAAASIEHPNVLPIYYAGELEDELYIVMRYVDGQDLRTLVRASGSLPPQRAAGIVSQVAAALDAAHERGLVHRDVKPANVLLAADDHAYLTDFGLAKRIDSTAAAALSRPGGWVGTLGYVAPEQIRGERVDARTDVYALGCILVHALTGKPPYTRESEEATLWAHLHAPPPDETDGVPASFAGIVGRALAKDMTERYPSAGDLGRAALAAAGAHQEPWAERTVARGAAAPEGSDAARSLVASAETTRLSPPADAPTAPAPTAVLDPGRQDAPGLARRVLPAVGAIAVVIAAIVVGIVLLDGGEEPATPGPSDGGGATRSYTTSKGTATDPVVERPTALAVAAGNVWTTSYRSRRAVRIDAATLRRERSSDRIPIGTTDLTADGDTLWLVSEESNTLTHLDARTGAVLGRPQELPPGNPFAVGADADAIWVGSRGSRNRNPVQQVLRIDKRTRAVRSFPVPRGVIDLAVSRTAVWVTNARGSSVTRLDKATDDQRTIRVGQAPKGVAVGAGLVWVANSGDGTVSVIRSEDATDRVGQVAVGAAPQLIAYGDGGAWVSLRDTSEVVRVDRTPATTARVRTAANPFALAVAGDRLFVASLFDDVVQAVIPSVG